MKMVYDKITRRYNLEITPFDKCLTCLNRKAPCPLLEEIQNQRVIIKTDIYKENCELYAYYVDEDTEEEINKIYEDLIDG